MNETDLRLIHQTLKYRNHKVEYFTSAEYQRIFGKIAQTANKILLRLHREYIADALGDHEGEYFQYLGLAVFGSFAYGRIHSSSDLDFYTLTKGGRHDPQWEDFCDYFHAKFECHEFPYVAFDDQGEIEINHVRDFNHHFNGRHEQLLNDFKIITPLPEVKGLFKSINTVQF